MKCRKQKVRENLGTKIWIYQYLYFKWSLGIIRLHHVWLFPVDVNSTRDAALTPHGFRIQASGFRNGSPCASLACRVQVGDNSLRFTQTLSSWELAITYYTKSDLYCFFVFNFIYPFGYWIWASVLYEV